MTFPDTLAPLAAPVTSPNPNSTGWNSSDVSVTWNWSDDPGGSGINAATCLMSSTSSGEGTLPLTATCRDLAGNTGTATVTVKVDKTNPTIVATAKKADGSASTFGDLSSQPVTVHYACADSGSLIASCTPDQLFSNDGSFSTRGTAVDNAGRSASSNALLVRIDRSSSSPTLSALITNKTGPENARAWTVTISNSGLAPASNVLLIGFLVGPERGSGVHSPDRRSIPGRCGSVAASRRLGECNVDDRLHGLFAAGAFCGNCHLLF